MMEYLPQTIGGVAIVVFLIADIRAIVLAYRARRGNERQMDRLNKQIKEFASL